MDPTVPIQDLRVGMYVHLGMGWMRHPFPLSSFRISSAEQIETIRGLGLERVRWVPEKSDPVPVAGPAAPSGVPVAPPAVVDKAAREADTRRRALDAQRDSQRRVERQYAEASTALRGACRQVRERPQQARQEIEALSQALVDKMLGAGEMCIRLLTSTAGDRATAHGMNVAMIAMLVGRMLKLGDEAMQDLGVGALLHDMGKVELPDRLRHVEDGFTPTETGRYRDHVRHGVLLGQRMGLSPGALTVIGQHHELADGSGFPLRRSGDGVAITARIVAVANRYDNLCNPGSPASAMTPHEALASLFSTHRQRFDGAVLNTFIRMMGVYPAGSVVQLTDERYALVVGVNSSRPLKPRVLVHDPKVAREEAVVVDLERAGGLGVRRSLAAAKLPGDALAYLAPRPRVSYFFEPVAVAGGEACT